VQANPQIDGIPGCADRILAAIKALSKEDLYRLTLAARAGLLGTEFRDSDEIFHEAIVRAMSGTRRWPREVPFVAFLIITMRSIVDASRNSPEQTRTRSIDALALEAAGRSVDWIGTRP
jgi:DNA-directed RNA polymerase specialized sigma24 family protein